MPQLFANNAASTLAAAITAADTSLTLATGTGSKFPSPTAGDFFLLTLTQAGQETSWEIVKVTARAGDVLTVVRAQEGGVAAAWGIGAKAELRITAGALDAKQPLDADLTAIAALAETSGLLKKTAANTWALDTVAYSTLALGSTAGSALAASGSAGTATTAAKSDHVHPFPTAANVGAEPAITKSTGFAKWNGSAWAFDNSIYQTAQSVTGIVKSSGTTRSAAVAGTDYVAPDTATTFTATQTFKGIGETVYNLTGTGINPANGTIQYKTLTANTTFTESLGDGQSVILMLNPSTFAATWPTTTWIGSAASTAPTLVASVYNCVTFFQIAGTLYGKYEGRV